MNNYYSLLGIEKDATAAEIKRAFREKAKQLHPDIAGKNTEAAMRALLSAYEALSRAERRFEYDRAFERFTNNASFDYRSFLRNRPEDPASQAKLIFFLLLHLEEEEALEVWTQNGGLGFPLRRYLDREDWMDCAFLLAEELNRRGRIHEAFRLLVHVAGEERRRPYFRHFMEDVEALIRDLVRFRLRAAVDGETYVECLQALLGLGFPPREEGLWLKSMAETLLALGDRPGAEAAYREAQRRNPGLPRSGRLRSKLGAPA